MKVQVKNTKLYREEFRRKIDAEKYHSKGTCEVHILLDHIEMDVKNITYRIDHSGKVILKPPFRMHSNKKAGIKPKLVPSIVFTDPIIWFEIEKTIKSELSKTSHLPSKKKCIQLDFWKDFVVEAFQ